ncbi:putative nucleotidyltransferase [Thermoanaerobacter sp. YS13]|uniref:nucleotidyltransferase n=1 Tax=Thermoanaerobacter sp. YS13 TaxID=1511746 RepID=UPI000575DD4C|nr:nucleotidyltransferase [Thermoanaerobacter sp. YS13]KHO62593.1 putative nucleotidyltransferase [Thermoanaerobacter sp. YS13]
MGILGIIVEYNPFHNGHLYHLQTSKKLTKCDYTIAVMSGNFVQRGEPAIVDKWKRTEMALRAGIDLVIELPVVYATSTAENFAYGAVKLLDSLKIVDRISFGSEKGDLNELTKIAAMLLEEPIYYKKVLKEFLKSGITFAKARELALQKVINNNEIEKILQTSNNILAIEYLKALKKIGSFIIPFTIKRRGSLYTSLELKGEFASASSIRKHIFENGLEGLEKYIPDFTKEILQNSFEKKQGPISLEEFSNILIYLLRNHIPLNHIFDVSEGLENKIYKASYKTNNVEELIKLVKSKRYTESRIRHILIHLLLNIDKQIFKEFDGPNYIRVLGFNEKGKEMLREIKKKSPLPIITKVSQYKIKLSNTKMFEKDLFATDVYTLAYKNSSIAGLDFIHPLIKL